MATAKFFGLVLLTLALFERATAQKYPFVLPFLPYNFDATAPAIDGETNQLHGSR